MLPASLHPFEYNTGSSRLENPRFVLGLFLGVGVFGLAVAKLGFIGLGLFLGLFFMFVYAYLIFRYPVIGLYTIVAFSFFVLGMGRYVKDVQFGLGVDGILLFTYLALFMNKFRDKINWKPASKDITILSIIWFSYTLFELFNPQAQSVAAWFSGRGISFYMFLIVPLTLLFFDNQKKIDYFFYLWGFLSILATLKGIMQLKMGVDSAEQAWLNEGNYKTHILFGKLRVFSFLSDAGQFGANQAYTAVVAIIYAMSTKKRLVKMFFHLVAILGLYGMLISGTRGAISIPLTGFATFFILRKNKAVLMAGTILLLSVFVFFKYTNIGQGNAEIRRMRTAFDPNDASLQVRLNNQKILKNYLRTRPFGGGIGHGGVKAQRYLPNAFLSQIATDSWYVLIWVEQGIVGLLLHLFILFYVVIKGSYKIMYRIRDPNLKLKMSALVAGMVGVMVASYGNAILGNFPTNILIFISMALLMNTDKLDTPLPATEAVPSDNKKFKK